MTDSAILSYLATALGSGATANDPGSRVYILEGDVTLGERLVRDLHYFGYEAEHFTSQQDLVARLGEAPPDVILCNMAPSLEKSAAPQQIRETLTKLGLSVPMLCVSDRDDFESRLTAAQAGADACLVKPLDFPSLVGHLTLARRRRNQPPYRILIVSDDAEPAQYYRAALTGAGMHSEAVTDPMQLLDTAQWLQPNLILMDVSMPPYSGLDLARALRLHQDWQGIPIIYLSAEGSVQTLIRGIENGADNFLPKPIDGHHLVAAVQARADRACQLAGMMAHDCLTGLFSHVQIKEQLAVERARAMRAGSHLSVAMIDIDTFRSVNEMHGYPMGDQVLKNLASFLRKHLRQQDSIGRYGGEEFVVILPDCADIDAEFKFNDIREAFKQIRFGSDDDPFFASLSIGIASMAHLRDSHDLILASEVALNAAKRRGRDRVCVEGDCAEQPEFA